jgi:Skp family chaperone for outer membrane proteins
MRASRQLQQTQRSIQTIKDNLRTSRNPKAADLQKAADELEKKLKELTETLNPTPAKQGMADRSASLQSQVMGAVMGISGAGIEPISQAAQVRYDKVVPKVQAFLTKVNDFYEKDVEAFKKLLKEADFSLFGPFTPLKLE